MKIFVELDEAEIKRAIEAHLDEQGYTVREITIEKLNDDLQAKAEVEKKSDK